MKKKTYKVWSEDAIGSDPLVSALKMDEFSSCDLKTDNHHSFFTSSIAIGYRRRLSEDPSDPHMVLEVDDKIDCAASEERRQWDVSLAEYVTKPVHTWYVATVVGVEDARLLVQFHNRPKPKVLQLEPSSLVLDGEQLEALEVR